MKLIEKGYLFFITSIIYTFDLFRSHYFGVGTWDFNRTIGWAWELPKLLSFLSYDLFYFVLGYGLLFLFNRTTHLGLSMIHLFLIVVPILFPMSFGVFFFNDYAYYLTWVVFLLNIILSRKDLSEA